jgi:ribosomal protein S18 acetylase RimI-like enzyme
LELKRLIPMDAEEYRALMLDAYQNHPDSFTSSVEERAALPIDWWHSRLSADIHASEIVIGAHQDDKLVGVVGIAFSQRQKTGHKATLFGMYVRSEYRQHGIGGELVRTALQAAKSRPEVTILQLTVTLGNHTAQKLYESNGFIVFGIEPYAVMLKSGYASKVHMWRRLNPENFPEKKAI